MPSYDFKCSECLMVFEERRSFDDARKPATCPDCGSLNTHKKLSAVAFIANGTSMSGSSQDSMRVPVSSSGCGCGACSCGAN